MQGPAPARPFQSCSRTACKPPSINASAVETLETNAGLWPGSEQGTRAAVDDIGLRRFDFLLAAVLATAATRQASAVWT